MIFLQYKGDTMLIKNGFVFTENNHFTKSDLQIREDKIFTLPSQVEHPCIDDTDICIDASGLYVIPGLTDIHFHGCCGNDFSNCTGDSLTSMLHYELINGITTVCPTTMTIPIGQLEETCQTISSYASTLHDSEATICGIHLEGPFISYEKRGAQNSLYILPANIDLFEHLDALSNHMIKIISLAPEVNDNLTFIPKVSHRVRISLAHSTSDYKTATAAFSMGASQVTHAYNAMNPFTHREPGIIGAAFDYPDVSIELICDGIHVHPSTIRATFKMFTDQRILLISDSMEATGMPSGIYSLGGQTVYVSKSQATLSDGTIAGSVSNLMDCVRYLVKEASIPLESAIKCSTINPAKSIGIDAKYGTISPGKIADLVLLDTNLDIKYVIKNGVLSVAF